MIISEPKKNFRFVVSSNSYEQCGVVFWSPRKGIRPGVWKTEITVWSPSRERHILHCKSFERAGEAINYAVKMTPRLSGNSTTIK